METIHHLFASLDIFSVLVNIFPAIFKPLIHGFRDIFWLVFTSLKHLVTMYPGLISGAFFMSVVYFLFTLFTHLS